MPIIFIALLTTALGSAARDSAPRFSEVKLSTGVRLHYAEEGAADAPPVILLHGLSDSWFSFSRVMSGLAENQRVYALDLRGHGNSDRPASGYAPRDLATDVIAFMDAKKIARATIIGHSMGSFVAQQVALAAPRRVTAMVLVGSATKPANLADFASLEDAIRQLPEPVPAQFARDFQLSTVYQPVGDAFIDKAVEESLKLPLRVWRELAKGMMATETAIGIGRANIPTLVMRGEKDTYALQPEMDALVKMIPGAQRKVYPETGHAPHWERPAEFVRDVQRFMNDVR